MRISEPWSLAGRDRNDGNGGREGAHMDAAVGARLGKTLMRGVGLAAECWKSQCCGPSGLLHCRQVVSSK